MPRKPLSKALDGRVSRDLPHFRLKGLHVELSQHIKEHRARLGMSQEQLAEAIIPIVP